MTFRIRQRPPSMPTSSRNADVVSAMAAVALSIENVSTYSYPPISGSGTDDGYGLLWVSSTNELNLQVFAAEGHPWPSDSTGFASFVDAGQAESATSNWRIRNSIAVVGRNGHSPSLSTTPRVIYSTLGNWLQAGIKLEAAQ